LEDPVGVDLLRRLDHCGCASSEQLGPAGVLCLREAVESLDEFVVELYENFSSAHDHMVGHMVSMGRLGCSDRAAPY